MQDFLFFSNNDNKILEITNLFNNTNINILNLNNFNKIKSPNEIGKTFAENAKIKSLYGLVNFNKSCFADDSGICIESMSNKPGVESKKFLTSEKNCTYVFNKIINTSILKNNFSAYFQTTICLSLTEKDHIFFTGKVEGKISKKISGLKGFGYDPIFIPNGHKNTFADMDISEKNLISHRSIAITKLKKYLKLI